ncbi:hypothetical protein IWQ62_002611 [Dispira parvispora]|uniref:Uncharacterized protein n=1 Tax=Dispira parvispora TaxID=1520584 RepID=A0A9W8E7U2_9FUNG|nr:hypothetical protein IWQ62_002611 [Dispira parvispora]
MKGQLIALGVLLLYVACLASFVRGFPTKETEKPMEIETFLPGTTSPEKNRVKKITKVGNALRSCIATSQGQPSEQSECIAEKESNQSARDDESSLEAQAMSPTDSKASTASLFSELLKVQPKYVHIDSSTSTSDLLGMLDPVVRSVLYSNVSDIAGDNDVTQAAAVSMDNTELLPLQMRAYSSISDEELKQIFPLAYFIREGNQGQVLDFFTQLHRRLSQTDALENIREYFAEISPELAKYIPKECKPQKTSETRNLIIDVLRQQGLAFYIAEKKYDDMRAVIKMAPPYFAKILYKHALILLALKDQDYNDVKEAEKLIEDYSSGNPGDLDLSMELTQYPVNLASQVEQYVESISGVTVNTAGMENIPEGGYYIPDYLEFDQNELMIALPVFG